MQQSHQDLPVPIIARPKTRPSHRAGSATGIMLEMNAALAVLLPATRITNLMLHLEKCSSKRTRAQQMEGQGSSCSVLEPRAN